LVIANEVKQSFLSSNQIASGKGRHRNDKTRYLVIANEVKQSFLSSNQIASGKGRHRNDEQKSALLLQRAPTSLV